MFWKNLIKSIFNNFWAKIIALILAVGTWFYVFDLVNNSELFLPKGDAAGSVSSRYNFVMKTVPVKPLFFGMSPTGYSADFTRVKVVPSEITIVGPEGVVNVVTELVTDKIDISEYTKSVKLTVEIHPDKGNLPLKGRTVDVYIPVIQFKNPS